MARVLSLLPALAQWLETDAEPRRSESKGGRHGWSWEVWQWTVTLTANFMNSCSKSWKDIRMEWISEISLEWIWWVFLGWNFLWEVPKARARSWWKTGEVLTLYLRIRFCSAMTIFLDKKNARRMEKWKVMRLAFCLGGLSIGLEKTVLIPLYLRCWVWCHVN